MSPETWLWAIAIILVACCIAPMIVMTMRGRRAERSGPNGTRRHPDGGER